MFKKKINKWIQIEKKNQSSIIKFKINFFSEIKKSGRQGAPAKPERWAHQRAVANWLPSVPDVPVNVSVFVCECVCVSVCVYTSVFSVRFSITHESEWCWGFIARINRIDLNGIFFFFFCVFGGELYAAQWRWFWGFYCWFYRQRRGWIVVPVDCRWSSASIRRWLSTAIAASSAPS